MFLPYFSVLGTMVQGDLLLFEHKNSFSLKFLIEPAQDQNEYKTY